MSEPQWPTMPTHPGSSMEDASDPTEGFSTHESSDPTDDTAALFAVLIEQNEGFGNGLHWAATPAPPRHAFHTRAEARLHAEQLARTFSPRHPMTEHDRWAYRVSADEYLTIVRGATTGFSYRVSVVEVL